MQDLPETTLVPKKVKQIRGKRTLLFSRIKRRILTHVWLVRSLAGMVILLVLAALLVVVIGILNSFGFSKYTGMASDFIFAPPDKITSIAGRTNILILGKGGKDHEAPDLTDTIIFASVSQSDQGITLVSIPRDVWITSLRAKVNSAYYWGNKKTQGGGLILAKATVEEVVGQPIQYVAVVNFSGLTKVVDALGGVEVEVENSFVDQKYPIPGRENDMCGGDKTLSCRYETVSFEKGIQLMDGNTTLKFVRSRYAQGDEGTDFARAARQQKVIEAIGKKITSKETLLSFNKIKLLLGLFDEVVETDLSQDAKVVLARKLFDNRDKRRSYVLGEDLLENPAVSSTYDNLYVFIPKGGNWDKVHAWIDGLLKGN